MTSRVVGIKKLVVDSVERKIEKLMKEGGHSSTYKVIDGGYTVSVSLVIERTPNGVKCKMCGKDVQSYSRDKDYCVACTTYDNS